MDLRRLNPFWRQLPVYSPVTFRSLWAGLAGAVGFGDPLTRLRELLTEEYGCRDLILTDSGTSALRLAIEASIEETGSDIVALPAYCCYDVATAAVGADARVALYDVRPETLGPDFDTMRDALESGARAVVVAHLYGIPVDLDRSRELCDQYGAVLIEDAAQGAGGAWRGRPLGAHGDLAVLSFGRGKGRTGGGGGALLGNTVRGESLRNRILTEFSPGGRGILGLAKLTAQWVFGRPWLFGIPARLPFLRLGQTLFKEPWAPRGAATGPIAALLTNWKKSKEEERLRTGCTVATVSSDCELVLLGTEVQSFAAASRIRDPVLVADREVSNCMIRGGIGLPYPSPLCDLPAISERLACESPALGARRLSSALRLVPSHSRVRQRDRRALIEALCQHSIRAKRVPQFHSDMP